MTDPCPTFESETIRAMHVPFEGACDSLQLTHRRARSEVVVANVVAEPAKSGERDSWSRPPAWLRVVARFEFVAARAACHSDRAAGDTSASTRSMRSLGAHVLSANNYDAIYLSNEFETFLKTERRSAIAGLDLH
jgi:hypothetical protein